MPDTAPEVDFPSELVSLKYPLPHLMKALVGEAPVRIVAMGSSSTAGRADVVPYPHRLEMYLRVGFGDERFPNWKIDVLNRGRGGDEAIEELRRFDSDIFAEKPSLVIWQVGTNAVFHNYKLDEVAASISEGLQRLSEKGMDVLLIDPQYTPAMLFDDKADASERMVSLISAAALVIRPSSWPGHSQTLPSSVTTSTGHRLSMLRPMHARAMVPATSVSRWPRQKIFLPRIWTW